MNANFHFSHYIMVHYKSVTTLSNLSSYLIETKTQLYVPRPIYDVEFGKNRHHGFREGV